MKQKSSNQKTRQQQTHSSEQVSSAGSNAVATLPPDYGIDSVDNQIIQTMPVTENKTGLPDRLKAGVESLSGYSLDDVRVHYNSSKPAKLSALAYTQGTDIHVAPGQERYLPHEAWHVAQQKQGRVQPTLQMKGTSINDDSGLESEATEMGKRALRTKGPAQFLGTVQRMTAQPVVQRVSFSVKSHMPGTGGELDLSDTAGAQFSPSSAEFESNGRIQINASTDAEAQQWHVGHVQTLYAGAIKTKWKDASGTVKALEIAKTKTVRDGDAGDGPWYEVSGSGNVAFSSKEATVNVRLWDEPTNPVAWDETDKNGNTVKFAEMNGKDTFCTWIMARNEMTKAKEYLTWETWHVDWGIKSDYWTNNVKAAVKTTGATVAKKSGTGKGGLSPEFSNSAANADLDVKMLRS